MRKPKKRRAEGILGLNGGGYALTLIPQVIGKLWTQLHLCKHVIWVVYFYFTSRKHLKRKLSCLGQSNGKKKFWNDLWRSHFLFVFSYHKNLAPKLGCVDILDPSYVIQYKQEHSFILRFVVECCVDVKKKKYSWTCHHVDVMRKHLLSFFSLEWMHCPLVASSHKSSHSL